MDEKLQKDYLSTIGVDVTKIKIKVSNKKEDLVTLSVWDLAGQNQFQSIRKQFYLGANLALLIFDVTNKESFQNISNWINELESLITSRIPLVLVGNKIDLPDREVSFKDMNKFASKSELIVKTHETSALTGSGIKDLFKYCAEIVHNEYKSKIQVNTTKNATKTPKKSTKKSTKKGTKKSTKKKSSKKRTTKKK